VNYYEKFVFRFVVSFVGTISWFSFVRGDIIDSDILAPEENEAWHVIDFTTKPENGDKVYGRLPEDCINPVICFFSQDVWFDIVDFVRRIAVFLVCVLLLMIISVFPLYNIFEKLGEKWSKSLIPIKNLYYLANLVNTRKLGVIWWGLSILWRFLVSFFMYTLPPCMIAYDFKWRAHRGSSDVACWLNNIWAILSCLPVIIVFLIYDYLVLVSFYRLFRKFDWSKWYSVLWTIFFPIWACVLWFGNFECQWKNLEKKEWNN